MSKLYLWLLETLVFEYLIYEVTFYSLYLFSKLIGSKCKPHFLAENVRESLFLNDLCLLWPILDPKNILLLMFIVSKCLWLTILKDFLFLAHISHENLKLIIFSTYLVCITRLSKWVKFGLQKVKLLKVFQLSWK